MYEMNVYIFKKSGKCYHVHHCPCVRYMLGEFEIITKQEAEKRG